MGELLERALAHAEGDTSRLETVLFPTRLTHRPTTPAGSRFLAAVQAHLGGDLPECTRLLDELAADLPASSTIQQAAGLYIGLLLVAEMNAGEGFAERFVDGVKRTLEVNGG